MRRALLMAALALVVAAEASGQGRIAGTRGFSSPAGATVPSLTITDPTANPHATSDTTPNLTWQVSANGATLNSLTYSCSGATTIGSTALTPIAGGSASISTLNVGTNNCPITLTYNGSSTISVTQTFQVTSPDAVAPTITITSDLCGQGAGANCTGANRLTSLPSQIVGTATDNVGVTSVTYSCQVSAAGDCGSGDADGGNLTSWSISGYNVGSGQTATITTTARDLAANSGTDTIQFLLVIPLNITDTTLPGAIVGTAYSRQLAATGGVSTFTWDNNGGGTSLNDGDAHCAGLTVSTAGLISGTPSANGTCDWTARVRDSDSPQGSDTQALSIVVATAGSESSHTYFCFQVNCEDAAMATATSSGRQKCPTDGTGTNCIVQFTECPDATYAHNGACSMRSQAQLQTLGSSASVASVTTHRKWVYLGAAPVGGDPNEVDAARLLITGTDSARVSGSDGIGCNRSDTVPNAARDNGDGIDRDNSSGLGFGASVAINSDHDWDVVDDYDGCQGADSTGENLTFTFDTQSSGTLTIVMDVQFPGDAWRPSGGVGAGNQGAGARSIVADCVPGTGYGLGGRVSWKFLRIQPDQKLFDVSRLEFAEAHKNPRVDTDGSGADTGFWDDCDQNVVALAATGSQKSMENPSPASYVAPDEIGINHNDQYTRPCGRNAYYTTECQDYPIVRNRVHRIITHIELRVPANDAALTDWEADCDLSNVADAECAAMEATITAAGGNPATSLWNIYSQLWCDEERGCQRIAWRYPYHTAAPCSSGKPDCALQYFNLDKFRIMVDPGGNECDFCADAVLQIRNVYAIRNITGGSGASFVGGDLDDTGCPTMTTVPTVSATAPSSGVFAGAGSCPGDGASITANQLRRPDR